MTAQVRSIVIGSRGSDLALSQTGMVRDAIKATGSQLRTETKIVSTTGDKNQGKSDKGVKDKKEWIDELESQLIAGNIDLAVHSGKDVPVDIAEGTKVLPILKRESPLDVFISRSELVENRKTTFEELSPGSRIGTSSLRRQSQILHARSDLGVIAFGGNVPTRLEKLKRDSSLAGVVIARAGLNRLGFSADLGEDLSSEQMLPAVHQGALVLQFREDDKAIEAIAESLGQNLELACWQAERACVRKLGADCMSSVAVYCSSQENQLHLQARVLSRDGVKILRAESKFSPSDAEASGIAVAEELLSQGAVDLL